ncbi:MAG: TonB-dependent receptor [Ignavibacteriales bacterium]|nr:TonB-dependent receptor [Ignavibacteriales bacterium]
MKFNEFCIYIVLLLVIAFNSKNFSQNDENYFKGRVIDGQNLEVLPFANISYEGTTTGTTSDEKGYFQLPFLANSNLIVSYVGFKSLIIPSSYIKNDSENLFTLFPIDIFLQEVTVYSSQSLDSDILESNNLSIQSERIREISSAMPDILRSVQALPGIAVNNEFKADFNVRGGTQDENLVLVNGAQVYEPYHIKEVANASVGIFNVDLIKKVDLITGGFSAKYGDKMSSVLNIQYREGDKENYKGAASLSLAYGDAYAEGPITDNSSFILGFRKSYMEYVLSLIDYEDINTMQPSFYDIQGVVSYNFSPTNKLLFEFIHSGDDFSYTPSRNYPGSPSNINYNNEPATSRSIKTEDENNLATYYTNLFDVQSINTLSNKSILNFELSYYSQTDDEYRLFERIQARDIKTSTTNSHFFDSLYTNRLTYDSLEIETLEIKSNLIYQFNPNYEINVGASFQKIFYMQSTNDLWTYTYSNNLDDVNNVERETLVRKGSFGDDVPVNTESYKYNAYIENIYQINQDITINLGGRIDYFEINKDLTFSPRFNFAYNLGANTILRGAWGHFYQSPNYRQLLYSESSDTNTQSQKAIHYILGIENTSYFSNSLSNFFKIKLEGYYKDYYEAISSWYGTFERLEYSRNNDANGNAKGMDLYAVLSLPGFYTWLSYGLLFADEDKIDDEFGEYPRYTDQRHSISLVTNVYLGNDWSISLKGFYGSGFPYTPKKAVHLGNNIWDWKDGEIHSKTLPAYKRVDLRVSKTFKYENSDLDIFIDVSNIFNFKNVFNYKYDTPGYGKPSVEEVLLWPIIPSFGIRWQFN